MSYGWTSDVKYSFHDAYGKILKTKGNGPGRWRPGRFFSLLLPLYGMEHSERAIYLFLQVVEMMSLMVSTWGWGA
jgi:hypothetical protein